MKNQIKLTFALCLLIFSCSKGDEKNLKSIKNETTHQDFQIPPNYSSFIDYAGSMHNSALNHIEDNFDSITPNDTVRLCYFNNEFIDKYYDWSNIIDFETVGMKTGTALINKRVSDYYTLETVDKFDLLPNQSPTASINTNFNKLIFDCGLNVSEAALLQDLKDATLGFLTNKNITAYSEAIEAIENFYENEEYDLANNEGLVSGIAIGIAKHSLSYWSSKNFDNINPNINEVDAIPVWVAWDLTAALGSMGYDIVEHLITGIPLDVSATFRSSIKAAIFTSVGYVWGKYVMNRIWPGSHIIPGQVCPPPPCDPCF